MVDEDLTHTFHPPHFLDLSAADLPEQVRVEATSVCALKLYVYAPLSY
jgi:hypothetical protein